MEEKYAKIAEEVLSYVQRDMTALNGGFYSAEDADSEGEEGKFYVWRPEEIQAVLGDELGELFCSCYHITPEGNFEHGTSVMHLIDTSISQIAKDVGMTEQQLQIQLNFAREKLFLNRKQRIHPHKDDKILTSWNGLMIAAFAYGARVLRKSAYAEVAGKAVQFVEQNLAKNGRLFVRFRDGDTAHLGNLDDYAYFVWGLLELYQATLVPEYLNKAMKWTQEMITLFEDKEEGGGFYFSGHDSENLISTAKDLYDGAYPSGNSVSAYNLIRLAKITGDERWRLAAEKQLHAFAGTVKSSPISHTFFLIALQFALESTKEIVLIGDRNDRRMDDMINLLQGYYLPDAVLVQSSETTWLPILEGKKRLEKPTAYICENFACKTPTDDITQLKLLL